MSALALSRDRLEDARKALDEASLALMSGDVRGALKRCSAVYASLQDCYPVFANDWRSADLLIGTLSLVHAWCQRHAVQPPDRLRTLTQCALDMRLGWLEGDEEAA